MKDSRIYVMPPSRRQWRQRLKNSLLYYLMRSGWSAAERLPIRGVLRLVGCVAPYIFRRDTRRAEAQIHATMPHLDGPKTIRRMFVHFAESIWELSRYIVQFRNWPPMRAACSTKFSPRGGEA